MKKLLVSIMLVVTLLFCGCGCNGLSTLNFNNAWNNGDLGKVNYSERLSYTVRYLDTYTTGGSKSVSYEKSQGLKDVDIDIYGTYNTELEVFPVASVGSIEEIKDSNILDDYEGHIIKLTTRLEVEASYSCDENPHSDFINTVTYFCNSSNSFAPLYSKTENSSTVLRVYNNKAGTIRSHNLTETFYNKTSYRIINTPYINGVKDDAGITDKTYNYTLQTIVDNTQLLFALRNIDFQKNNNKVIPTVSSTYGNYQNISASYFDDKEANFTIENSTEKAYEMKSISFVSSVVSSGCAFSSGASGRAQIAFIANNADYFNGKAQIVQYVEPLTSYDNQYMCMGVLEYTLNNVVYQG